MIYIYDILLNFCDNDLVYDFYEWEDNDDIENVKRIKLLHVSKDIYDKILNYDIKVEKDFLIKIYKTCEIYSKKKIKVLDYCLLFSDGDRVVAVEFDKDGVAIYKSKLLIDEEEEIAVLASNLELTNIFIEINNKVLNTRFYTRKENTIRRYLLKEINDAYKNIKTLKLKYLYQEYFEKKNNSNKKMKEELLNSLNDNINDKHLELYNLLRLTNKNK